MKSRMIKKEEEMEKMIRDKISKEYDEKLEKEKSERAEKDKRENKKEKEKGKDKQDFQNGAQTGPDIIALLTALQAKVEELAKDFQERKEREKMQNQFQMWYPQYQQQ